jgi:Putative transmembrane protein (PGPGW)
MLDGFTKAPPGRRFRNLYELKRASPGGRLYRCAAIAAGVLLFLVGVCFLALPGPGIPILLLGAGLVAQQSRGTAQILDRTELRLRRFFRSRARG